RRFKFAVAAEFGTRTDTWTCAYAAVTRVLCVDPGVEQGGHRFTVPARLLERLQVEQQLGFVLAGLLPAWLRQLAALVVDQYQFSTCVAVDTVDANAQDQSLVPPFTFVFGMQHRE